MALSFGDNRIERLKVMEESKRHILAGSQLFSGLDDQFLRVVADMAVARSVRRQEILFSEGDVASALFLVGGGKIKIFKLSQDGKEQILRVVGPGQTFAEAALFDDKKYPATAQALEDSSILAFSRERFVGLIRQDPHLAMSMIGHLSHLLRKLTELVEGLSLTDVTTRLAHYLADQIQSDEGRPPHGQPCFELTEKKTVLASQLGTIPETLSRSLARLARDNVIAVDGPEITVLDPQRLKQLGGG
ncbi:MAG: Crp/Fnr family transcriptional regulator [Candidatus Zixiibacteriota bacterium]